MLNRATNATKRQFFWLHPPPRSPWLTLFILYSSVAVARQKFATHSRSAISKNIAISVTRWFEQKSNQPGKSPIGVHSYEKSKNWLIFGCILVLKWQKAAKVKLVWRPIGALSPNLVTLMAICHIFTTEIKFKSPNTVLNS